MLFTRPKDFQKTKMKRLAFLSTPDTINYPQASYNSMLDIFNKNIIDKFKLYLKKDELKHDHVGYNTVLREMITSIPSLGIFGLEFHNSKESTSNFPKCLKEGTESQMVLITKSS